MGVSYEYDYEARIGTGFKVNNQYVASGLSAKVVVTNHGGEETYFKVTQVRLGEHTGSLVDLYEESLFKKNYRELSEDMKSAFSSEFIAYLNHPSGKTTLKVGAPDVSGGYSLVLETSDGTQIQDAGAGTGPDGAVETQGSVRFIHPNGQEFVLKYVANAEGAYQPESSALPVAPAFPHPIPAHALAQIEKAARERP